MDKTSVLGNLDEDYSRRETLKYTGAAGAGGLLAGGIGGYLLGSDGEQIEDPATVNPGETASYDDYDVSFENVDNGEANLQISGEDSSQSITVPDEGIYDLDMIGDENENKIFEAQRVLLEPEDGLITFEIDDRT